LGPPLRQVPRCAPSDDRLTEISAATRDAAPSTDACAFSLK